MPPVAWDRLADALHPGGTISPRPSLSIITLGHVHTEDLGALTPHFGALEQLVLDVPPRDPVAAHRAEFNRAVDAASHDWVAIVRERESVDDALASEMARAIAGGSARGFRIRSEVIYRGKPLRIGSSEGDVRMFHRRYYLRYAGKGEWTRLAIQGTVVRLESALQSTSFATAKEHAQQLGREGVANPFVLRILRFAAYAVGTRTADANTLRYLWVEAGYDRG